MNQAGLQNPEENEDTGVWRAHIVSRVLNLQSGQNILRKLNTTKLKLEEDDDKPQTIDDDEEFMPSEDSDVSDGTFCDCRFGLRHLSPRLYTWLMARMGAPSKVFVVVLFMLVDASRTAMQERIFQQEVNIMFVILVINVFSLAINFVAALLLEGGWGMDRILDVHSFWRFILISFLFQVGYHLYAWAFFMGAPLMTVLMLGYLYLPVSAVLSTVIMRRTYGQLEWLSLSIVMLATMSIMFLRVRCKDWDCSQFAMKLQDEFPSFRGLVSILFGVTLSCTSSTLAERIFKDRSVGLIRVHGGLSHDHYYIHKVHLDFCGVLVATLLWLLHIHLSPDAQHTQYTTDNFGTWDTKVYIFAAVSAVQWWLAGFVCKRFSTTVKALLQTFSTVTLVVVEDAFFQTVQSFGRRALPTLSLMLIVGLAALIFQTGRLNLRELRTHLQIPHESKTQSLTLSNISRGFKKLLGLEEDEEDVTPQLTPQKTTESKTLYQLAKGYFIIIAYILADASRTELYTLTVGGSMITPQSYSVAVNGCMMLLSVVLILTGTPQEGSTAWQDLIEACSPWHLLRFMPCGFLFALTSALMSMAIGMGLSGAMSVVIGRIYLPICAIASAFVLGKFYLWLEWFAIIILTVDAAAFGSLKSLGSGHGAGSAPPLAILICAGSAASAALSAIVMEKLMTQDEPRKPFMMQKLRTDFACFCWSIAFLPVMGMLASPEHFAKGAYWLYRPLDYACNWHGNNAGICGGWDGDHTFIAQGQDDVFAWGQWTADGFAVNATIAIGDCACGRGVFIGWGADVGLYIMLALAVFYGFITGVVVMTSGSVARAIADAFSLMLVYFVGDPLVKHTNLHDMSLNLTAVILALSSQTFSIAAAELKKVSEARVLVESSPHWKEMNMVIPEEDEEDEEVTEYSSDG